MNTRFIKWIYLINTVVIISILSFALNADIFEKGFRDNFNNLDDWEELFFPKIKNHSRYKIINENSNGILEGNADNSASGIIYKKTFNIYRTPFVKWRWKISNIYKKGDEKKKSGDDYPIRIYIVFKYNPDEASLLDKVIYNAAKLIYGEYPPHSSINYIWANKNYEEHVLTSTYTDRAKMVLMQKGSANAGKWMDEQVNVLQDYISAFGTNPPAEAGIAIMSDADNTGEKATGYVDYIEVYTLK